MRSLSSWCFAASLLVAASLALNSQSAPTARAQDCETGGARVTFDPVSSLVYSPNDGPIEVTAANGGLVKVKSPPAPSTFTVSTAGFQRNAVAARFRFDRNVTARLVVERTAGSAELNWIAIERDSTTCAFPIESVLHDLDAPATYAVDGSIINEHPLEIRYPRVAGSTTMEITAPFKKGVIYRVVFYLQTSSLNANATVSWTAFGGPRFPDPDPALKILPPGADPLTGCPGTDLSNLNAAYRAESIGISHFQMLNQAYADLGAAGFSPKQFAKIKVTPADVAIMKDYVSLSLEHLNCARMLVEGRTDLSTNAKATALAELDQAIAKDEQALVDLATDTGLTGSKDAELLARMSLASITLTAALQDKRDAGAQISPGYMPPPLEAALNEGAALTDAIALAAAKEATIESAIDEYRGKLEMLAQEVRDGGAAALDRVIASNQNERCLAFLEATIIGDLNEIVVAFERQEREQEVQRLMDAAVAQNVVRATQKVTAAAVKQATAVRGVVGSSEALVKPTGVLSTEKQRDRAITAIIRQINLLGRKGGTAAIAERKRLTMALEELLK